MKQRLPITFLLCMLFSAVGCKRGAKLTVINDSEATLNNVVASGEGFTEFLGSIPHGDQRHATIQPAGESSLKLEFDADGKHFSSEPSGYFEASGHYKVTATISPDFTVTVKDF
jgi:hypothetical protein